MTAIPNPRQKAALRRARSRSGERGAALFIVVLVTVLLSAIGIFAVRVSSLVQVASGYNRRATSAYYLAELGTNVVLTMHSDDKGTFQSTGNDLVHPEDCQETAAARAAAPSGTIPPFCHVVDSAGIAAKLALNNGSLGAGPFGEVARPDLPLGQSVVPSVKVEITESALAPGLLAGSGQNSQTFQASYTATGHLYSATVSGTTCNEDSVRASATTKLRAFVTYSM